MRLRAHVLSQHPQRTPPPPHVTWAAGQALARAPPGRQRPRQDPGTGWVLPPERLRLDSSLPYPTLTGEVARTKDESPPTSITSTDTLPAAPPPQSPASSLQPGGPQLPGSTTSQGRHPGWVAGRKGGWGQGGGVGGRPRARQMAGSARSRHRKRRLFNDTLGLVTNIRNYKRRTGSHTEGTGGDTAQQSQQQNILRTATHVTEGRTRGCPRGSDPDGGTGPPASQQPGGAEGGGGGDGRPRPLSSRRRWRQLVPSHRPSSRRGWAVFVTKADGALPPPLPQHRRPVLELPAPLPALDREGAGQGAAHILLCGVKVGRAKSFLYGCGSWSQNGLRHPNPAHAGPWVTPTPPTGPGPLCADAGPPSLPERSVLCPEPCAGPRPAPRTGERIRGPPRVHSIDVNVYISLYRLHIEYIVYMVDTCA